jgi:hypothetical protein
MPKRKRITEIEAKEECPKNGWHTQQTAKTWEEIEGWRKEHPPRTNKQPVWIFRGQGLCAPLQTKLEEAFHKYNVPAKKRRGREIDIIRRFQRRASLYLPQEPDKDDILEWLALMRHHGAPTRFTDWTYSFYIALYFALARNLTGEVLAFNAATVNNRKATIDQLKEADMGKHLGRFQKRFKVKDDALGIRSHLDKLDDLAITSCLIKHPVPLVYAVNPFRMNMRLTIQQGLFLVLGDIRKSFTENLRASLHGGDKVLKKNLHRLALEPTKKERNKILFNLRDMNISNEVLFPGLDGFASTLFERLAYPY